MLFLFHFRSFFFPYFVLVLSMCRIFRVYVFSYVPWICSWYYFVASDTGWHTSAREYRSLANWYLVPVYTAVHVLFCSLLCDREVDLISENELLSNVRTASSPIYSYIRVNNMFMLGAVL